HPMTVIAYHTSHVPAVYLAGSCTSSLSSTYTFPGDPVIQPLTFVYKSRMRYNILGLHDQRRRILLVDILLLFIDITFKFLFLILFEGLSIEINPFYRARCLPTKYHGSCS